MVERKKISGNKTIGLLTRRPTIISPVGHIRSYSFGPFLALNLIGCVLSLIAGYTNAVCLVGFFQMPLTASTGASSKMVVELAKGEWTSCFHFFLAIFSFVLGSFISAALVGGSSFRIQRLYGLVLILESFAFAFGYIFETTTVNPFGSASSLYIGAYLISLACGLQNGMCTTFSGAVIRTTHVTGILTDIGLILGQATFYPRTRKHLWKLKVLLPLYTAFCIGGLIGWFAYNILFIQAILVPCAVAGLLGVAHICYCKIILMYKSRHVSKKHYKRNRPNRAPLSTADADGNTNTAFDKRLNNDEKNLELNCLIENSPSDLQMITIHDSTNETTTTTNNNNS